MSLTNNKFMMTLATALAKSPKGTYQEIADNAGISRATLYRLCGNRKALIRRLLEYATVRLTDNIRAVRLEEGPPVEALERLLKSELEYRPLHLCLTEFWSSEPELTSELTPVYQIYEKTLDDFFLRGQREGVFRIDIPAAVLNETLTGLIISLIDAERRGRIASASLPETVMQLFLEGALLR